MARKIAKSFFSALLSFFLLNICLYVFVFTPVLTYFIRTDKIESSFISKEDTDLKELEIAFVNNEKQSTSTPEIKVSTSMQTDAVFFSISGPAQTNLTAEKTASDVNIFSIKLNSCDFPEGGYLIEARAQAGEKGATAISEINLGFDCASSTEAVPVIADSQIWNEDQAEYYLDTLLNGTSTQYSALNSTSTLISDTTDYSDYSTSTIPSGDTKDGISSSSSESLSTTTENSRVLTSLNSRLPERELFDIMAKRSYGGDLALKIKPNDYENFIIEISGPENLTIMPIKDEKDYYSFIVPVNNIIKGNYSIHVKGIKEAGYEEKVITEIF